MTTRSIPVRLDLDRYATGFGRAMAHLDKAATKELDAANIDPLLRELVRVRASQINGCAYCVDMHTRDARAAGETEQRLYAVAVWEEAPFFTDRERAALAFTESVTLIGDNGVPDDVWDDARKHFDHAGMVHLIMAASVINVWNRLAVSTRQELPELH